MKKLKNKEEREKQRIWLKGYDDGYKIGVRDFMKNNDEAIRIGSAIIEVLDRRYKSINNED